MIDWSKFGTKIGTYMSVLTIYSLGSLYTSQYKMAEGAWSPVDLYLICEKSSSKNQVRQTEFLACKNQFQDWFLQATQAVKVKFEIG